MNTGSSEATVTVSYLSADATKYTPASASTTHTVPANSSAYLEACAELGVTGTWSGSATVEGGGSDSLVAVVFQPYIDNPKAVAYEALIGEGSNTIFFPAATNRTFGPEMSSFYAIQNVDTVDADVTVTVYNQDGSTAGTLNFTLAPGAKTSVNLGQIDGVEPKINGSSVATSVGGKIAAITNIGTFVDQADCPAGAGQTNAYLNPGDRDEDSSSKLVIPWIEYKYGASDWQSFIAVQNVNNNGNASGAVTVTYYDANGNAVGTGSATSIADKAKANFNYKNDVSEDTAGFVGSVVIESATSTDKLVAFTNHKSSTACHGSNALAVPVN
jgi:hypothetical protein